MAMKYVSAYLMLVLAGKENPSKKEVEKTLASVGIDSEGEVIDALLKSVEGKSAHELICEGMRKLQAVPTGGGAVAAPAAAAGGGPAAAGKADAAAAKKEEPKEEEEEEDDMGFSLFD